MDNGHFKGWVSRSFDKEISEKRKYLYNKGFRRRTTLAGWYKDTEVVMLVEGYMDCVSLYQYGVCNGAASLGTALTENQAKNIAGLVDAAEKTEAAAEELRTVLEGIEAEKKAKAAAEAEAAEDTSATSEAEENEEKEGDEE